MAVPDLWEMKSNESFYAVAEADLRMNRPTHRAPCSGRGNRGRPGSGTGNLSQTRERGERVFRQTRHQSALGRAGGPWLPFLCERRHGGDRKSDEYGKAVE